MNFNKLYIFTIAAALSACGGGSGGNSTVETTTPVSATLSGSGFFSDMPISTINVSDANACFTQFVVPVDMNKDGQKDLAMHFWCNQWNMPAGFNGPTPNTFKVYLNNGNSFENGNVRLFGAENIELGGASRKFVQADFNNDGSNELAFAINREDGRLIGNNLNVASSQSAVVTSSSNRYAVSQLGTPNWFHAVDVYQTSATTKSVVFMGFSGTLSQSFSQVNGVWATDNIALPPLNALTYRFMKSSLDKVADDVIVTVGAGGPTTLDVYSKTSTGWQKGNGYNPTTIQSAIPLIAWNGDLFMGNKIDINGVSYTGAGFDDSCIIKRSPTSPALFVGKFSGNKLPAGYAGEPIRQNSLPLGFELMAFEIVNGSLRKVDLGLNPLLGSDFFNFFDCTDVNNDGYDDIVISRQRAGGLPDVYLNNTTGGFTKVAQTVYPIGNAIESRSILADLDGDKISELIVFTLNSSPQTIRVYKGIKKLQLP